MAVYTLTNTATSDGMYNGVLTDMTTSAVVTQIVEGLSITKTADQASWATGNLTYTITITNETDVPYSGVTLTDTLEPTLITFVPGSLTIAGTTATTADYTFDDTTGLLSIAPVAGLTVAAEGSAVIIFQVSINLP